MELPEYTQAQFDTLIAQLQPIFQVSAINYDASPVGTPQHREGWRLMLLYLELAGQTAMFKVWVEKGEVVADPGPASSLAGVVLREHISKGGYIEIPSLGIVIGRKEEEHGR